MKLGYIYIPSEPELNETQIHPKCNLNKNELYLTSYHNSYLVNQNQQHEFYSSVG